MESFLLPVYTSRATLNTEETPSTSSESHDSQIPKEPFGDETTPELHEATDNERTDSEVMATLQSPRTPTSQMQPTQAKNSRRRSVPNTAEQQMATAFGQLTNVLGQRQSHTAIKEDDDCDFEDQPDNTDDDLLWFKSILPYMKQLPSLNKLHFRTQMQELLLMELSKLNPPQSSAQQHGYYTSL
ncbi:uncharacterized protein [Epargyreus clarus]|uniref:uncharacterized protein n=1 Tax=Epargyreus clarus TaxID=520877 RepID=UPI003C2C1200